MSMLNFVLILAAILAISCQLVRVDSHDQCVPCKRGTHVACESDGSFGEACSTDAEVLNTDKLQTLIVAEHNSHRNKIAGGTVRPFQPAVRMATIRWDQQLADFALLNAKSCIFKHDQCHTTKDFQDPGQNIAYAAWYGGSPPQEEIIQSLIGDWFDEYKLAFMSDIAKIGQSNASIGHFTVMVNERNTHVGCGAVKYDDQGFDSYLMTCNYAVNNGIGKPVYESGPKPASKCNSGINPSYKNLCSTNEVYSL